MGTSRGGSKGWFAWVVPETVRAAGNRVMGLGGLGAVVGAVLLWVASGDSATVEDSGVTTATIGAGMAVSAGAIAAGALARRGTRWGRIVAIVLGSVLAISYAVNVFSTAGPGLALVLLAMSVGAVWRLAHPDAATDAVAG